MPDRCVFDLLRHGDTGVSGFRGSLDDPLSDAGWQQMREALQLDIPWQAVISSPLRRCADFAKIFAEQNGLPLVFDARLRELHFGDWEGQSAVQLLEENASALTQFWNDPWACTPPNGEHLADLEQRVRFIMEELCSAYCGKRILLITHGGVIRMMLFLVKKFSHSKLLSIDVPQASLHTLNVGVSDPLCC